MRLIVIIFASLVILFAGGCLVVTAKEIGALGLPLLALLALNVAAIWVVRKPSYGGGVFLMLFGLADIGLAGFMVSLVHEQYVGEIMPFVAIVPFLKGLAEGIVGYRILKGQAASKPE